MTNATDNLNRMVPVESMEPITAEEFLRWLDRDITFLDGVAAALENQVIGKKLHSMHRNVKRFKLSLRKLPDVEDLEDE